MDTNKEIRIYGTLVNWTIDPNKQGTAVTTVTPRGLQHYDAVAYAKHLYDDQFGDPTPVNNFQDVINRRVTGITYNNGTTTIAGNTVVNNLTVNGTVAGLSLNDLSDVNAASPANGQYLKYNGSAWVPTTLQVALSDIAMPSASAGQVLKYDGTKWVAGNDNDTQGSTTLAGLTDTSISSPASGLALKYDGSKWVNSKLSLSDITLPAASNGQVLKYVNGGWTAAADEVGSATGGSTITVTPSLSSGTKVADYTINGASGSLYAPNPGSTTLTGLTDTSISNPLVGQTLVWNGTAWVNQTPSSTGSGSADLSALEARIAALESMWEISSTDNTRLVAKSGRSAVAAGFYDSSI